MVDVTVPNSNTVYLRPKELLSSVRKNSYGAMVIDIILFFGVITSVHYGLISLILGFSIICFLKLLDHFLMPTFIKHLLIDGALLEIFRRVPKGEEIPDLNNFV